MREKNNYSTENVHLREFIDRVYAEQIKPIVLDVGGKEKIFETFEFEVEEREDAMIDWILGNNNYIGRAYVSEFLILNCLQMVLEEPHAARLTPLSMDSTGQKNMGGDIILTYDNTPVCLIDVTLHHNHQSKINNIGVGQLPRVVLPIRDTKINIPNNGGIYSMYSLLNNVIRPSIRHGFIDSNTTFFHQDYLAAIFSGVKPELDRSVHSLIATIGRKNNFSNTFEKALLARKIISQY